MVCIYCSRETLVTNSRPKIHPLAVWRRRQCLSCRKHFTTNELPVYEKSLRVVGMSGNVSAFNRDRMLLSLFKSLGHRPNSIDAASAVTNTVLSKLVNKKYLTEDTLLAQDIAKVSFVVLKRFDHLAAATYKAYHQAILK